MIVLKLFVNINANWMYYGKFYVLMIKFRPFLVDNGPL